MSLARNRICERKWYRWSASGCIPIFRTTIGADFHQVMPRSLGTLHLCSRRRTSTTNLTEAMAVPKEALRSSHLQVPKVGSAFARPFETDRLSIPVIYESTPGTCYRRRLMLS